MANTDIRTVLRTFESHYWLLPHASAGIWPPAQVLVSTPSRAYTVGDISQLLADLPYQPGVAMYRRTGALATVANVSAPGVNVYHLFGTGLPTAERLDYATDDSWDAGASAVMGDGDGSVNAVSLRALGRWAVEDPEHTFIAKEFPGKEHLEMMTDPASVALIVSICLK